MVITCSFRQKVLVSLALFMAFQGRLPFVIVSHTNYNVWQ
jgi:hypothetical protein